MGRLVLIYGFLGALAAGLLLTLWYVLFAHYNRRRGILALTRVQAACGGKGFRPGTSMAQLLSAASESASSLAMV